MRFRQKKTALDVRMSGAARPAHSWAADVGPGLVTIASDNDPGGLATYTLAGAWYGFDLLWVCVLSYPSTVARSQSRQHPSENSVERPRKMKPT